MDQQSTKSDKPEKQSKTKGVKASGTAKFALLIGFIALIASALSLVEFGVNYFQLKTWGEQSKGSQQQYTKQFDQLQQQVVKLTETQDTNTTKLNKLFRKSMSASHTGLLDEAEYLLRVAMLNQQYVRNIPAAVTLVKAADERLAKLHQEEFNPVRQQLAQDLLQLRAAEKVDTTGILGQLQSLSVTVPQLKVKKPESIAAHAAEKTDAKTTWRQSLNITMHALEKVVVVRHSTSPLLAVSSEEQRMVLNQNLQLILQKAQLGLLAHDATLYKDSLKQAQQWMKQYFVDTDTLTKTVLEKLSELQQKNIHPQLPDIEKALTLLKQARGSEVQ